jgi:hypothetical protein
MIGGSSQPCVNCPSGYFVAAIGACVVGQITTMLSAIPPHRRGTYRDRHETWSAGSGGRVGVAARYQRADDNTDADGEIVWSWRRDAGAKFV